MKKILSFLVVVIFSLTTFGCTKEEEVANKINDINIGAISSLDALPMVIAKEKGFFKDNDLNVNVELFNEAPKRDAALQAGKLDGLITDDIALAMYLNSGHDLKIVSTTTGQFSVIVNKKGNVKNLSDLKDKKIAIFPNGIIELLTDKVAIDNGLKVSDIKKINIPVLPARIEALNNNQIDATILPAPYDSLAEKQGNKILKTLSNDDIELTSFVFNNELLVKDPSLIDRFIKSYNQAVDYINVTDVKEFEDMVIDVAGYSKDSKGNIKLPHFRYATLPKVENVQSAFDWAYENKLVKDKINAVDVIKGN